MERGTPGGASARSPLDAGDLRNGALDREAMTPLLSAASQHLTTRFRGHAL
jgi:hypothetical protein